MKKVIDKILSAIVEMEDATDLLKGDIKVVTDLRKREDFQKIISLLDRASILAIDALTVSEKYEIRR